MEQYRVDTNGLVTDTKTGRLVAIMTPIHGAIRSICKECGREITATKDGGWIHSDGSLMMHRPSPSERNETV